MARAPGAGMPNALARREHRGSHAVPVPQLWGGAMSPRVPIEPLPPEPRPLAEVFAWGFAFGLGVAALLVQRC